MISKRCAEKIMRKIPVIFLFTSLSMISCNSLPLQVTADSKQQNDSIDKKLFVDNIQDKLNVPMTQDKYSGYVEWMGRCPDRFDYLYEAAFAYCYAVRQNDPKRKAIVKAKAKEYYQIWIDYSSKPKAERMDFYTRDSDLSDWMISRYQQILRYDPNHPFKKDLLSAIEELEANQKESQERH